MDVDSMEVEGLVGVEGEFRACKVSADDKGIRFDNTLVAAKSLVGAVTEAMEGGHCIVWLVYRRRRSQYASIRIHVPDPRSGDALIHALGLGVDQKLLTVGLSHQTTALDISLALGALLALVFSPAVLGYWYPDWQLGAGLFVASALFPLAFIVFEYLFRVSVSVGLDGIERRTWRSRSNFRYSELNAVERGQNGPRVRIRDKTIELFHSMGAQDNATIGELLYRRIWQGAFAQSELRKKRQLIADVREVGARLWIESWRGHTPDQPSHYRAPALVFPNLRDAVVDVTQPLQVRVGAAIALRATEGTHAEQRIRVAASTAASPRVRELFERIAEDADDEELIARIEKMTLDPE